DLFLKRRERRRSGDLSLGAVERVTVLAHSGGSPGGTSRLVFEELPCEDAQSSLRAVPPRLPRSPVHLGPAVCNHSCLGYHQSAAITGCPCGSTRADAWAGAAAMAGSSASSPVMAGSQLVGQV